MTQSPISPSAVEFGEQIRARREALGLTQEKLATRCNVHWTFLGQVERGQRNIRLNNILKLADGLDIDPGELIAGMKPAAEDKST